MMECPACKHRDYAFIGQEYVKLGEDFKEISRDIGLVACPECNCVIYDWMMKDNE